MYDRDRDDAKIDQLKEDITNIQQQLYKRRPPKRKRAHPEEVKAYYSWRSKAVGALQWKQGELASLKIRRREYYRERGRKLCADGGEVGMLYRVYRVCKRLLGEVGDAELRPEEQQTLDDIQAYLRVVEVGGEDGSSEEKA